MLKRFLAIMISGVLFALPLGVLVYVFSRVLGILKKLEAPLADKMGIQHLLGEFTLTILAVAVLLLFCFLLGLLLQRATVLRAVGNSVEGVVVRVIPSMSFLKSMAEEKFDVNVTGAWKGALIENEGQWKPGFLVEETEQRQTFFIPESFKADSGGIMVVVRGSVTFKMLELTEVKTALSLFGQGLSQHLTPPAQPHPQT